MSGILFGRIDDPSSITINSSSINVNISAVNGSYGVSVILGEVDANTNIYINQL